MMEAGTDRSFWERIKYRVKWIFEELKEDSVAKNPSKPVDCCNPPVYDKKKGKN